MQEHLMNESDQELLVRHMKVFSAMVSHLDSFIDYIFGTKKLCYLWWDSDDIQMQIKQYVSDLNAIFAKWLHVDVYLHSVS